MVATAPQLSPQPAGPPQLPDTAPPLLPPPPGIPLPGGRSSFALSRQSSGDNTPPPGHARSLSDLGSMRNSQILDELNHSATYM